MDIEKEKRKRMNEIFISDTTVKRNSKLSEDFLRPAYQYTSIETYNWGRDRYYAYRGIN